MRRKYHHPGGKVLYFRKVGKWAFRQGNGQPFRAEYSGNLKFFPVEKCAL